MISEYLTSHCNAISQSCSAVAAGHTCACGRKPSLFRWSILYCGSSLFSWLPVLFPQSKVWSWLRSQTATQSNCRLFLPVQPGCYWANCHPREPTGIWEHVAFRCAGVELANPSLPGVCALLIRLAQPLPLQPFRTSVSSGGSLWF